MADLTPAAASDTPRPRRTVRRYAHELFPAAKEEAEVRPLSVEVPHLYALALGHDVSGTSWFEMTRPEGTADQRRVGYDRIIAMVMHAQTAFLADALQQGLAGDEAWAWATERIHSNIMGECVWERAVEHGVDPHAIKPYRCGPEPDHHDHLGDRDERGWRRVTRVEGPESECDECCEPEPVVVADEPLIAEGGDNDGR